MEIGPLSNKPVLPVIVRRPASAPAAETPARQRKDTVEISDDARRRLAQMADHARQAEQAARNELLVRIHHRIESGFYDQPQVREHIADRLLEDFE